jgi:putative transposase
VGYALFNGGFLWLRFAPPPGQRVVRATCPGYPSLVCTVIVPKRLRINAPGSRHFVTFGTYKRRRLLTPNRTKDIVVEVLQKCLVTHEANCAGFVVMPDHVHAIVFGSEEFNVSSFIQVWKKTSSYRIKKFYGENLSHYVDACPEEGPIWQPGFYDFNADSDRKHNEKLGYMHSNPVEAKLVDYHISWNWSSARFYELGDPVGVTITI